MQNITIYISYGGTCSGNPCTRFGSHSDGAPNGLTDTSGNTIATWYNDEKSVVEWALNESLGFFWASAGDNVIISTTGPYNPNPPNWAAYSQYNITYNGVVIVPVVPATVAVYVQNNIGGSVDVYRNSALVATVSTSQTVNFNVGDSFTFTARPSSGYTFQKFCTTTACTISTTANPFTGTITQTSGSIYTFFVTSQPPPTPGYKCTTVGQPCTYVTTGATHTDQASCNATCITSQPGYRCTTAGQPCTYVTTGATHADQASCNNTCITTTQQCNSTTCHDGYCLSGHCTPKIAVYAVGIMLILAMME